MLHHGLRRAAAGAGGALVKSVILDCADNYGDAFLGLRSVEFKLGGNLIAVTGLNADFYATTFINASGHPENAFITALSKTGGWIDNSWLASSGNNTNQRLIIVFNTLVDFDEIVINNSHDSGLFNIRGVENVKIYTSTDEITSTVYGQAIPNSALIYDSIFDKHVAANIADDQILSLI